MAKKRNALVFMDVSIDGDPVERMVFELYYDIAPKTAENFRALCTGERGVSPNSGKSLHYKGSFFHQILKGSVVQGGDFVNRNGTGGESIYGFKFPDESPRLTHDARGLLSMSIADRDTLGSHFIITLKADPRLDRKNLVFGKLVQGHKVLKKIEDVGDKEGHPTVTVKIINCGGYSGGGKKMNKLKTGSDVSSEANSQEVRGKRKHKKSSRDRRKRRKYNSSESETSSDSDSETSESDSDSDDTDVSSSSYLSSSSDDRRRKRKRSSRKDKHRRGKRRNRHRDKRRRKRDKRSKRRLKRGYGNLSDSDSESTSDSSSDSGSQAQAKDQRSKDHSLKNAEVQSPLIAENELPALRHKEREEVDMLEEEELPKENGGRHINGIGTNYRSDRSEERKPDVVDDHPGKSRSRSMSPKRNMSMSISPRNGSKSPSISPKRRLSRSPSGSRSPRAPSRSLSRSPVRSITRSPVRGRMGRSDDRSPVKFRNRRSVSRSPVRSLSRSRRSSSPRPSSRRMNSRSPFRSRKSANRSPVRSSARSLSRSSGRVSRSPVIAPSRSDRRSYSRSRSPVRRARSPRRRSVSRSVSPDVSPKRVRRGRGFSDRYSYARRYRTPSRSPLRSYRYNGRNDRDRYSGYRRYSPRQYRSPPHGRSSRYRGRRSRTPSVSRSPRYRSRRYSSSQSPVCSHSPVEPYRPRASPRLERRMSSRNRSPSRSRSLESQSPQKTGRGNRSRSSSSGSPAGKKGLVSYDDVSPDSSPR